MTRNVQTRTRAGQGCPAAQSTPPSLETTAWPTWRARRTALTAPERSCATSRISTASVLLVGVSHRYPEGRKIPTRAPTRVVRVQSPGGPESAVLTVGVTPQDAARDVVGGAVLVGGVERCDGVLPGVPQEATRAAIARIRHTNLRGRGRCARCMTGVSHGSGARKFPVSEKVLRGTSTRLRLLYEVDPKGGSRRRWPMVSRCAILLGGPAPRDLPRVKG
jgi:hypothetical protein